MRNVLPRSKLSGFLNVLNGRETSVGLEQKPNSMKTNKEKNVGSKAGSLNRIWHFLGVGSLVEPGGEGQVSETERRLTFFDSLGRNIGSDSVREPENVFIRKFLYGLASEGLEKEFSIKGTSKNSQSIVFK